MPASRPPEGQSLFSPEHIGISLDRVPTAEPISVSPQLAEQARTVQSFDNGEPLVAVEGVLPVHRVYAQLPFRCMPPTVLLRQTLVERLVAAHDFLPEPFSLVVIDGWRSLAFQQELLGYYSTMHESLDGYVSDPDDTTLLPPHVTGGAVDLTLAHEGRPLALGTDFDAFHAEAAVDWFENGASSPSEAADLVRGLRRLLASALTAHGLAPLPEEWWHWSFGDQRWAAFHGLPRTDYAPIPE
jgi:D-alanyl-D-alanine dipeptidase